MTIQDVGSIGELVAAIATIATLGYLAIQVRQSSTVAKTATAISHTEAVNSLALLLGQNSDLAKLYFDGLAGKPFSEAETRQFEMLLGSWTYNMSQSYVLEAQGFLDSELVANRDLQLHWIVCQPGFRNFWSTYGALQPPRFSAIVEDSMNRAQSATAQQSAAADSA